jgi:uncharacterized membrane protein YdbT with pleckstrin-like domain
MPSRTIPLGGIERYLAPGERVAHISRRHPIVLAKAFFVWLITLLAIGLISFFITRNHPIPIVDTIALGLGILMTIYLAFKYLEWWKVRYVITEQRVLLIEGIFATKVTAVSLSRVTETSFSRSLAGRVLGYGDLKLDSASEHLKLETLQFLPHPEAQYRLVASLLIQSQEADRGGARRVVDPSEESTGPLPPVVP